MKNPSNRLSVALWAAICATGCLAQERHGLPEGFVYLDEAVPGIVIELKYATEDNFVGQVIDGYGQLHAILSEPAAAALAGVQASLQPFGLGLKVFDAYRPQRAVDHFVRWSEDPDDQRTRAAFYPDVAKEDLFEEGYIAARSGHSRGSTVDLTLVYRDEAGTLHELDMGSDYDFFGPVSWPASSAVSAQQRANRALLHRVMTAHGFNHYDREWWHFTLADEPYPDTYFDFLD